MKPGWRIALPVAGVIVLLGLAALPAVTGFGLGPDVEVPLYEVRRGDFVRRVVTDGFLEADETTPVTIPPDVQRAFTVAWLAPDGSRVKEGDVLVRFDSTEMERELRDGEAELESVSHRLEKQALERDATLESLDHDAGMAERELTHAREFQSTDEEIYSRREIIESRIDEDLATRKRDHALESREIREELSGVETDLLRIERRKAQMKIEEARKGLEALELRAPHDGIFIHGGNWDRKIQVGQTVWTGFPIGEIPRLDTMNAKVYVLEADAGGLAEGVEGEVALEAYPGESYAARAKQVAALAQPRVRRSPVQYFEVVLELERTDPDRMKPGSRVQATLVLEERTAVLTVPREAVVEEDDGDRVVYVRRGGGFEPVEVELGPSALGSVVIESGLEEGDVVALGNPEETGETEDSGQGGNGSNGGAPGVVR